MRAIYLEIDGQVVDLPANSKGLIKLMQAQNALAELETRVGEYSWPLTLPLTRRNCIVFEQKQHPQTLDKFSKTDYSYFLRCDSEVFYGTFRLSSIKNGFTGQLLGEGFSWALALANKKLTDLRFAEVEYNGSQLEAIQALTCDQTDIQFPLVSYGNFFIPASTTTNQEGEEEEIPTPPQATLSYPLSVDDYYYGVYYRNIIRQIFQEIGWQVQGSVLDLPEVREWVLTLAGGDMSKAWAWGGLLPASCARPTPERYFSYYGRGPLNGFTNSTIAFDSELDIAYFMPRTQLVQPGGTRALAREYAEYLAPKEGVYDFSAEIKVTAATQHVDRENDTRDPAPYFNKFAPVLAALVVFRGGEGYAGADGGICATGSFAPNQDRVLSSVRLDIAGGWNLRTGTFPLSVSNLYLEPGDTVRLLLFARRRYSQTGDGVDAYKREEFSVTATSKFACTRYEGELTLQPSAGLPALLQKDVVKDFMKRTNTVPVADFSQRVVTLMRRQEQQRAAGPALELSDLVDPEAVEHVPVLGAGVGLLSFRPAEAEDSGEKAPLVPAETDVVKITVGKGPEEKTISTLFAPVAVRSYRLPSGGRVGIPTIASLETLKQNCSEVDWDLSSLVPRLVRYRGTDPAYQIPFQLRQVPLAVADWSGALAWDGEQGAIQAFYAGTVGQAQRGHVSKFPACLSPQLYRQLTPGREVWLFGGQYTAETASGFDPVDEAGQTSIELLRVI
ncbi:hypothetical protein [Hymenobacter sp. YC55]|uniref:hypothetical protein n=1 Tax=Hymenobacter sp. YC55 TaxID=3034019 RepID=UPI0023FA0471|nr:hypothetical protein [Hymenobacter sp. YC55]MDF7810759.1 hypothetical protein [Hymenobacter sp. YC55]